MAGIYIHIPFCRQACHYCDFHFSTNLKNQSEMIGAICKEIHSNSGYLSEPIETIYFGGGTPSLLSTDQISRVLNQVYKEFEIALSTEITLEANPEDLDKTKCEQLKDIGINRLSIGFQTFENEKLMWMNRAHNSQEAKSSLENARAAGFDNVSLDLIYALPNSGTEHWQSDITQALELDPDHISLYGLTIEDRTVFGKRKIDGQLVELPEEAAAKQYLNAIQMLADSGFQQYEVSNFAKSGYHSRHNNAYWNGVSYLGVGPGAHSYNGQTRQFNIRNNPKYIKSIAHGITYFEVEELTKTQLLNEHILTGLRKVEGISLKKIQSKFDIDLLATYKKTLADFQHQELIKISDDSIHLTSKGFLVADDIALQLFLDE